MRYSTGIVTWTGYEINVLERAKKKITQKDEKILTMLRELYLKSNVSRLCMKSKSEMKGKYIRISGTEDGE